MGETVQGEVKIVVAKEVIIDLLNDLPAGSNVGLRDFAGCEMTHLLIPISPLDVALFSAEVSALTVHGATSIQDTLDKVPGDFANVAGRKLILLITDGMETCNGDPVKAAEDLIAAGLDLRINVVGFDIARVSKARDQLMQIAQVTGGVFLEASNREELRQALSLLAPFSYSVYDSSGNLVYSGRLGETTGPQLPAGTYRVVINTSPEYVIENVVISSQQTTVISVVQQNGGVTARVGG